MNEVSKFEKQGKRVSRFSVMGYSLGGLLARYVIGYAFWIYQLGSRTLIRTFRILHQNKFFETITPVNFNTVATPHIGIPRFPTAMSTVSSYFGSKFLSRTGEQFYCTDKWSPKGRPLIEVLGDPGQFPTLWKLVA